MKKIVLTFGILSGLIIIIYSAAVFLVFGEFSKMSIADLNKVEKLGYLRYIILLLTIIFAVRSYKKQNGGRGTFKQLFLAGFYTTVVVGVLVGLMELVYMVLNPGFMEQYATLTETRMKEQGASAELLSDHKAQMESMKWMATPVGMGVFYFFETTVLGTIISVITALIGKSKTPKPAMA
jgi:Protein of unknown function (DUF4199)